MALDSKLTPIQQLEALEVGSVEEVFADPVEELGPPDQGDVYDAMPDK